MKKTIHLIRHGLTEGNLKRWYYGSLDIPLKTEGIAEIKEFVGKKIYPKSNGNCYTSGLKRTEETFRLIYGQRSRMIVENFREIDFGMFEGKSHQDLIDDPIYVDWIDNRGSKSPPEGESISEFRIRVMEGFSELLRTEADEEGEPIVVCHGGVIGVILSEYFMEDDRNFYSFIPEPGRGYSVLTDGDKPIEYREI